MRLKEAAYSHASLMIHSSFQLSINRGRCRAMCADHSLSPSLTVADAANVTDSYQSLLAAQTHSATATKKKKGMDLFCLYVFLPNGLKSFQKQVWNRSNAAPTHWIRGSAIEVRRGHGGTRLHAAPPPARLQQS